MRCHCFSKKICFNQHDCVFMFQLECFCKAGKAKGSRDPRVASPPQQRKPNLCSGLLNFYFLNFKETYAIQSDRRDFPLLVVPPRKRGQLWEVWGQGGWSGWSWRPWSRREPPSRWRCSSRRWSQIWPRRRLVRLDRVGSHCWWLRQSWAPWRPLLWQLPDLET